MVTGREPLGDDEYADEPSEPGFGVYIAIEQADIREITAELKRRAKRHASYQSAERTWATIQESLRQTHRGAP